MSKKNMDTKDKDEYTQLYFRISKQGKKIIDMFFDSNPHLKRGHVIEDVIIGFITRIAEKQKEWKEKVKEEKNE